MRTKKILCLLLSIIMAFGVFCLVGCGDNTGDTQSYIDRIAELEEQLQSSGAVEVESLKAKVRELESTVSSLKSIVESTSNGNNALKSQLDSLNATVSALSQQLSDNETALLNKITALEMQLNDEYSGNAALLAKINELQEQLNNSDNAALKIELDALKAKYEDSESGNAALKQQITALESKLNDPVTGNAALKTLIDTLTAKVGSNETKIAELEDRITELENTLDGNSSGLIKQIADLTALVNETKAALDTANANITTLSGKVTTLETELAKSNVRIDMLESLQNGTAEQHIYTVCEDAPEGLPKADNTFTFVNNVTGLKLFSVKLTEWEPEGKVKSTMEITIHNYGIPSCVPLGSYFTIYAVAGDDYYQCHEIRDNLTIPVNSEMTFIHGFRGTSLTVSANITHLIVGLPTQDPSKQSILPYAIFKLPNAVAT